MPSNPSEVEIVSGTVQPAGGFTPLAQDASVVEVPADISAAALRQLLRQATAPQVILVVGPKAGKATSPQAESGLVLAQLVRRQADALGVQVAMVSRDEKLRRQAEDMGIPVFSTVAGARQNPWRAAPIYDADLPPTPARDSHVDISAERRGLMTARFRRVRLEEGSPRPMPAWLEALALAAFLVLSLLAVFGMLAFVVPSATVTLTPAQEPVAERVSITARSDVEAQDSQRRIVPARRIGQRVETEGTIQATGTRSAPDQPAQGSVVFTNRRPDGQEIPPGTVVATATGSNVRFETTAPAALPPGVGAQVAVPIRALEPGPGGNARAFTISTVEGPLGVTVNVTNPSDTYGGNVKQVPVVQQADKDRLRAQLEQQAQQKAYLALGDLLDEGEFVPPETIGTLVLDETYDRFTDEEGNQVTLRLRLLATALAVDGQAADEIALQALSEKTPRRSRLLADSISYNRGPAIVEQEGDVQVITFDNTASGVVTLNADPAAVRATIRGQTPAEAVAALQANWRLQSPPELTLGPDWLTPILRELDFGWLPVRVADRVPWLPFRTHVRVQYAES